ncbi:heat shock protein [Bernardetia litoralis DSM 6794]|uniref:Heat shock protein n=1 Tax=Bernardetia litoralis (strain ATCC 23117 / DSM 6794 / NBRC 15988 / NCIMB 1366 / Fx l1 / Sio-4) TaxID=880071 RepID=I4ALQ5_BERLS|nr:META domain-containing protein [Bernardetia litoralis]AFM04890.1 heat shock protein [Bernardetia litoralis DSM 6794]
MRTNSFFLSLLLIFSITILFSSCKSSKKTTTMTTNEKLARVWMLTEMDVKKEDSFSKEDFIKAKAELNLTKLSEITTDLEGKRLAQGSAFMGCNNIFFTISTNEKVNLSKNINFSQVGMTRKACQENMELEASFGKNLPNMITYELEGHFLTLSSEDGKRMKFVAQDWD